LGGYGLPQIREPLYWDDKNTEHLWESHCVTTDDVEEILFGIDGEDATYRMFRDGEFFEIFGEAGNGRRLLLAGEFIEDGRFRVFAARDMDDAEKRRYRKEIGQQ
jgi:uncharacterized DUF497 family protein